MHRYKHIKGRGAVTDEQNSKPVSVSIFELKSEKPKPTQQFRKSMISKAH